MTDTLHPVDTSPDALRGELRRLGLSSLRFSRLVGADYRTARRWVAGSMPVPLSVMLLLERLTIDEARLLLRRR